MSKEYRVTPPESMSLERMSAREIESIVNEHATRMLESMPEGFRPTGVNRVVLDRAIGRGGGPGVPAVIGAAGPSGPAHAAEAVR